MTDVAVEAWLDRAREALSDAHLLAEASRLHACVNRLYYACFYAATALLLSRGLSARKHSGVRGMLHREFVRGREVPVELGRFYDRLFDRRQAGDYEALTEFVPEQVSAWVDDAERFVAHVERLVQDGGQPSSGSN